MDEKHGARLKRLCLLDLVIIFIPIFGVIGFFRRKAASGQNRWLVVALVYSVMDVIAFIVSDTPAGDGFMKFYTLCFFASIVYACVTQASYQKAVIARQASAAPADAPAADAPSGQIDLTVSRKEPQESAEMPLEAEMQRIGQINDTFKEQAIYPQLCEIRTICEQIVEYIVKNSDGDSSARTFTSYYLPEYLKLMDNYIELSQIPVKTAKITKAMKQIQDSIPTTLVSFKNLYNNLYSDKASDISNSVDVFEKMMSQDGLSEDHDGSDSIHLKI